jgi:hypothetical protein
MHPLGMARDLTSFSHHSKQTFKETHSAWLDSSHQIPLQLNDYTSFLQQYSDTLLLKAQPEDYEIVFRPTFKHIDSYEYDINEESLFLLEEHPQEEQRQSTSTTLIMSNQQSPFHSQSYSSSTFSSSSNGEAPKTWSQTENVQTNKDGTTVYKTSERPGQAPTQETLRFDSSGKAIGEPKDAGRIEDVTDADRQYDERIEDEYAKREGGA